MFESRFALRKQLVTAYSMITGRLFGTSSQSGVIAGTGDWLFFSDTLPDYQRTNILTDRQYHNAVRHLELINEYCENNEIEFLVPEAGKDYEAGAAILQRRFPNIRLLNVTCGADGSWSFCGGEKVFVPAFKLGGTIETTGAGDTFCASVLHDVLNNGLENRSRKSLEAMLRFANAAAYLVTTKKGAIRSMPEREEVERILAGAGV